MVFLLGVRHAFEPDHLAIIDGMTRSIQRPLSKYVGRLFSFGHGLVIVLLTMLISFKVQMHAIPNWFKQLGIGVSIISLFILGIWNLYTTLQTTNKNSHIIGLKSTFLNKFFKFNETKTFITPLLVGMLFSLSFDTLSQTLTFSLTGYALAGWLFPILLGFVFMFGMVFADGLNGYLVAYILNRADQIISKQPKKSRI